MNTQLASVSASINVKRSKEQVHEYLIHNLSRRLGLVSELEETEDGSGVSGSAIPGSVVTRDPSGTATVHISGGRMTMWIVTFRTEEVGSTTNVTASVVQFNDNWLQRKTVRSKLQSYLDQILAALNSDLA